ncbi:MAG TPA: thiopeptide-type bacteriocin biosynthesis protein, partial [Chitinophagaceae bacterium]
SGANLLGRFCHLHPEIEELTADIITTEEAHDRDCIYGEIIHLPESRIGNILMRPTLRQYEIPYLCNGSVKNDFQIPVNDLFVGIENNKVTLRSKRLNKRIVPRLTTAHNYNLTTLPVYQFLCDLQHQETRHVGWQWGILESQSFLPRVSYGKFILSKARWILTKEELKDCDKKNDDELLTGFSVLREARSMPAYVLLSQGDNELMLHLENIFCIRLLLNEINKASTVTITETLDTPGQCWIESKDGKYAGEFILAYSMKNEESEKQLTGLSAFQVQQAIKRVFPVGSEWLYAKIYCGTKTAEKLLAGVLKPFTEELLSEKIIDKFFFLRYHDSANHIRIRFHNSVEKEFWKEVIARLQNILQPFFDDQLVHNLQFETYIREVERYGFDTMDLSENIFMHHSKTVLDFISMLEGDEGEQYRWQVALKAIDLILDDFSYSLEQKRDLAKTMNKNFSEEFKIGSVERKKISERFADHKPVINILMSNDWMKDENLEKAIIIFKNHDKCYENTVSEILNAFSVKDNKERLGQLMASYLHMFINRVFVSNQRKTELVIYEYLWKYYDSKLIREKQERATAETVNTAK